MDCARYAVHGSKQYLLFYTHQKIPQHNFCTHHLNKQSTVNSNPHRCLRMPQEYDARKSSLHSSNSFLCAFPVSDALNANFIYSCKLISILWDTQWGEKLSTCKNNAGYHPPGLCKLRSVDGYQLDCVVSWCICC